MIKQERIKSQTIRLISRSKKLILYIYGLKNRIVMTKLGEYLDKKSVNKAEIARRTGLNKTRITELTTLERAKLRADELYLIALAIDVNPCDILNKVCGHLKLKQ